MNESITDYKNTITTLEDLLEFHPEYLAEMDQQETQTLSEYYFAGRKVDVDDLDQYRDNLLASNPALQRDAQQALGKLLAIAKIK